VRGNAHARFWIGGGGSNPFADHAGFSWKDYLEGLQIVQEADGMSRLFGMLQDQAALY
jgi:hypothetical protein